MASTETDTHVGVSTLVSSWSETTSFFTFWNQSNGSRRLLFSVSCLLSSLRLTSIIGLHLGRPRLLHMLLLWFRELGWYHLMLSSSEIQEGPVPTFPAAASFLILLRVSGSSVELPRQSWLNPHGGALINQPVQSAFAGEIFCQSHGEVRIKLHSSKAQKSENNSFYPSRKEGCIPSSQLSREPDFLSLARKTEAQGFEVEGLFSCDPLSSESLGLCAGGAGNG